MAIEKLESNSIQNLIRIKHFHSIIHSNQIIYTKTVITETAMWNGVSKRHYYRCGIFNDVIKFSGLILTDLGHIVSLSLSLVVDFQMNLLEFARRIPFLQPNLCLLVQRPQIYLAN